MGTTTSDRGDRSASACNVIVVASWVAVAAVGTLMFTQAVGWDGNGWLATVHALTPYAIVAMVPTCGAALRCRRPTLGAVGAVVGLSGLILATPLAFPPDVGSVDADARGLRVASLNMLYDNERVAELADDLLTRELDVVVFLEYTPDHEAVLLRHRLAAAFPFKVDRNGERARGIAMWSRYPMVNPTRRGTTSFGVNVNIDGPDGEIRILGVHPPTPVWNYDEWRAGLRQIGDRATRNGPPTLIVGDFNASYWNPAFRDLLDRGFVDAHLAVGNRLARSWPTDEVVPPFVQIDHALLGDGLGATSIEDFDIVGSDHRGFVVTVAPTR